MKKFTSIAIFSFVVFLTIQTNAQPLIAVQNGGTPTFYTQLPAAIDAAVNGDTIYIPGGTWNPNSDNRFAISKTLHIIGTGHNPTTAQVGGICNLNGDIFLMEGASNGSITGVLVSGNFQYGGHASYIVSNYSLTRNRLKGRVLLSYNYSRFVIIENIFNGEVDGGDATDNIFYNNIFAEWIGDFSNNSIFKNNIMMSSASFFISNIFTLCFFENNIIFAGEKLGMADCIFSNNLFVDNVSFPFGTTNQGYNNIVNQTQSSIFVAQSGNTFNYTHDYHLKTTCPGKNAGKDGTDIGIYGGLFPWKEGSIPFNPHFESIQVAPNTINGNLNVKIEVAAQDR